MTRATPRTKFQLQTQTACALLFSVTLLMSSPAAWGQSTPVKGQISNLGDTTHIEFTGLANWDYQLKSVSPGKVVLSVTAFDNRTMGELKAWSDAYVKSVEVNTNAADGKYEVTFHLAGTEVESFDYLTDEPSRLILDFYKKVETPTPASTAAAEAAPIAAPAKPKAVAKKAASSATAGTADYKNAKDLQRKPAGDELIEVKDKGDENTVAKDGRSLPLGGVFDAGDDKFERFRLKNYQVKEETIIASRKNIYIRFPMLQLPASRLNLVMDNQVEYVINPKDNEENKQVRLLKTLKEKKRFSAFLKAYEFFLMKFPKSEYDEIVRNMAFDIFYQRYQSEHKQFDYEQLKAQMKYLQQKYPQSPLAERNALALAYIDLERKDALGIIQNFQQFITAFPSSTEVDYAKRAMAEGYLLLGKYEDALKIYEDLAANARDKNLSIEAEYRKGDVAFAHRDFPTSVTAYKKALEKFPDAERRYPNIDYNMAEAQFWIGNHKTLESLNGYIRFLELYPFHPHGGYALTRIGELLEISGGDKSKVMGAFLESYFRFRDSPGAEIARIRMLSQQMKGMRATELRKAIEEMSGIAAKSELPRMSEFVTLMTSEGLFQRGEFEKALNQLITYYQKNPTSANLDLFRKNILRNMSEWMKKRVNDTNFMSVLSFYDNYSQTWLRNSGRLDVEFFVGRAYEQSGVYAEAGKRYQKVLDKLKEIRGSDEWKERRVNEHLPTEDQTQLRMASIAILQREYSRAFDLLASIKNLTGFSESELIERVQLAAEVYEQRGEPEKAKIFAKNLLDAWKGRPELLAGIYLKLAELNKKIGTYGEAVDAVDKILTMQKQGTEVAPDVLAKALETKGEAQLKDGRALAAVETYSDLLEKFEQTKPLSSIRYKTGQILFDQGDIGGAEKIWNQLNEKRDGVYRQLAQEKLANAKWQDEYKRYINRIPAMSKRED